MFQSWQFDDPIVGMRMGKRLPTRTARHAGVVIKNQDRKTRSDEILNTLSSPRDGGPAAITSGRWRENALNVFPAHAEMHLRHALGPSLKIGLCRGAAASEEDGRQNKTKNFHGENSSSPNVTAPVVADGERSHRNQSEIKLGCASLAFFG